MIGLFERRECICVKMVLQIVKIALNWAPFVSEDSLLSTEALLYVNFSSAFCF